ADPLPSGPPPDPGVQDRLAEFETMASNGARYAVRELRAALPKALATAAAPFVTELAPLEQQLARLRASRDGSLAGLGAQRLLEDSIAHARERLGVALE